LVSALTTDEELATTELDELVSVELEDRVMLVGVLEQDASASKDAAATMLVSCFFI